MSCGEAVGEMPTINYGAKNGKKYRYFYGLMRKNATTGLMKCDTRTRSVKSWHEAGGYACEPLFVARPKAESGVRTATRDDDDDDDGEDDGVLLSLVISESDEQKGFLLVLDARTMKEVARADFAVPSVLTPSFHGAFLPD